MNDSYLNALTKNYGTYQGYQPPEKSAEQMLGEINGLEQELAVMKQKYQKKISQSKTTTHE